MAKKKTVVEKVKDAVDHVLHPDQPPAADPVVDQPEAAAQEPEAEPAGVITKQRIEERPVVESSSQESDLAKHPKFAKFKNRGNP